MSNGDETLPGTDDPLHGFSSEELGDAEFEAFLERMNQMLSSMLGEE
ncbi:hypothetical protein F3I62_19080 [Pseudomonas sp. R-28-1W-6]|nr:hypothetical protein [Pseudomonas sp. R-28-1W-6]MWV14210.1 hypothetical protein [Pseudomonas sp. R-28-1W-6]